MAFWVSSQNIYTVIYGKVVIWSFSSFFSYKNLYIESANNYTWYYTIVVSSNLARQTRKIFVGARNSFTFLEIFV